MVSGPIGPPDRGAPRGEGLPRGERGPGAEGPRSEGARAGGPPPRNLGNLTAWIDPGTGKVLSVGNPRS